MSNMLAVILAGGEGKRMDILCHVRPKPALLFAPGAAVLKRATMVGSLKLKKGSD